MTQKRISCAREQINAIVNHFDCDESNELNAFYSFVPWVSCFVLFCCVRLVFCCCVFVLFFQFGSVAKAILSDGVNSMKVLYLFLYFLLQCLCTTLVVLCCVVLCCVSWFVFVLTLLFFFSLCWFLVAFCFFACSVVVLLYLFSFVSWPVRARVCVCVCCTCSMMYLILFHFIHCFIGHLHIFLCRCWSHLAVGFFFFLILIVSFRFICWNVSLLFFWFCFPLFARLTFVCVQTLLSMLSASSLMDFFNVEFVAVDAVDNSYNCKIGVSSQIYSTGEGEEV